MPNPDIPESPNKPAPEVDLRLYQPTHLGHWCATITAPDGKVYCGSGPSWQAALADAMGDVVRGMDR